MPSFFFHIVFDLDKVALPESSHNTVKADTNGFSGKPRVQNFQQLPPDSDYLLASKDTEVPRLSYDWRYDRISVQNLKMAPLSSENGRGDSSGHIANGISAGSGGLATKGRYEPLDPQQEELGWGVVRLYRDSEETTGLYDKPDSHVNTKHGTHTSKKPQEIEVPFRDADCTTLCILAVPSYLTPSDFLGFVGEKTRDDVSHFRMIRTERGNRYMVLMKFRNGRKAREWRREWNGKPFDGMEVGFLNQLVYSTLTLFPARELSCRLRQVYRVPQARYPWSGIFIPRHDE